MCVKLINALTNVGSDGAQRAIATYVADERLRSFPFELGTLLVTIRRPSAPLLRALHSRLSELFPAENCEEGMAATGACFAYAESTDDESRTTEQRWQGLLLASASLAGTKFTSLHREAARLSRHTDPALNPARQIIRMYERLLEHVGGTENERWEQTHAEAEWRSQLHWESLHSDAKYSWVAHNTLANHEAMGWAAQNAQQMARGEGPSSTTP
jgi:hypothetical protein